MTMRTWNADRDDLSPEMADKMRKQRSRIREQRAAAQREVREAWKARLAEESQ